MPGDNENAFPIQAAAIDRVAVRLPPFWAPDPEMWFSQIENQFALAGITSDETKFSYVAGNMDAKYATEVRDILTRPPPVGKYEKLKAELIRRLSASQEQKTRRLLEHEEMGDRKPSQFLRHLQGLAGTAVPDGIVRSLWFGRLPASMQAILTTQANADLEAVAELADAIAEANPRFQVAEASAGTGRLEALVEQLTVNMAAMQASITSWSTTLRQEIAAAATSRDPGDGQPRRSRSRSRNRSRQRSSSRSGECWYHSRFGSKATKCTIPCSYKPENDQGSR